MELRRATPDDLSFIVGVEATPGYDAFIFPWSGDQHLAAMTDPTWVVHVLADPEPIAFAIWRRHPETVLELKRIAVAKPGGGIGRRSMEALLAWAFDDDGAARVWLDVFEDNRRARHLYRSIGFVEEETTDPIERPGGDQARLVIMGMGRDSMPTPER